jgi:hypothetical protein
MSDKTKAAARDRLWRRLPKGHRVNWLDTVLHRSREAKTAHRHVTVQKPPALVQAEPEIRLWWIQTAAPRQDDPGAVEPLFYFVKDGAVTLCDETGRPAEKLCG